MQFLSSLLPLILRRHLQGIWNDYYPNTIPTYTYESRNERFDQNDYDSVYITNCNFVSISGSDTGGAIRIADSGNIRTLIDSSMFMSCSAGYGGAISLSYNQQIVCQYLCGVSCRSTSMHTFIMATSRTNSTIFFYDSSVTLSNQRSSSQLITLNRGNINVRHNNITKNSINDYAGLYSDPESDIIVRYSYYQNNTAFRNGLIIIGSSSTNEMTNLNIIDNSQPINSDRGLIHSDTNTIFTHSCIVGNTGSPLFSTRAMYNGTITLSNCTIDVDLSSVNVTTGRIILSGELPSGSNKFTNVFPLLSTGSCQAEYAMITETRSPDAQNTGKLAPGEVAAIVIVVIVVVIAVFAIVYCLVIKKKHPAGGYQSTSEQVDLIQ